MVLLRLWRGDHVADTQLRPGFGTRGPTRSFVHGKRAENEKPAGFYLPLGGPKCNTVACGANLSHES